MRLLLVVVAAAFLVAHARALPNTLEDIDSINFAMGVESFDVASHQPHPPGYPIYIAFAKASTAAVGRLMPSWDRDERAAVGLALWSVVAGALAAFVIARLWLAIGLSPTMSVLAAVLTVAGPLFWLTAARPLSDTPGLVAGLLAQAWLVAGWRGSRRGREAAASRVWLLGAAAAGLAVGIRSQTMWLTGPVLVWGIGELLARRRRRDALRLVSAAAIGVLVWLVPLVWDAGGPAAYLSAVRRQGEQDFAGVEMLATTPTLDLLKLSLARTFDAAWQGGTLADIVLGLAVIGLIRLAWRDRRMLATLGLLFLPYLVFHLAFHETVTIRYALPLVVPVAGLAVIALSMAGERVAIAGAVAAVLVSIVLVYPRLDAYATEGAPVFRAFQDMQRALPANGDAPVLRMHHQVWWGVRRAVDWYRPYWDVGPQPFPGDREWLAVVQHWTAGHQSPIWYLTDLTRNDPALFDRRTTTLGGHYDLHPGVRELVGGTRLDGLNWWVIERPAWMLGTGWSVLPEIAGITSADGHGPHQRPAEALLRRTPQPMRLFVGGRYLSGDGGEATATVDLDGHELARWSVTTNPSWFVQWIDLPNGVSDGPTPYATLRVRVSAADPGRPAPWIGLEQFDAAPADDVLYAFVDGWHELEGNPRTGRLWRWTSERSTVLVRNGRTALHLTLSGESPMRYFDRPPTVVVRAGDHELRRFTPADDFVEEIELPADALQAAGGRVTIETDRTYVPGEREGTGDRRRVGLRLYRVEVHR